MSDILVIIVVVLPYIVSQFNFIFDHQEDKEQPTIRIHRLTKRFGRSSSPAIKDLTLRINAGECFGLLGLNGSGKSTTFAMLTREFPVAPRTIFVNGFDLSHQTLSQAFRSVGFCPQTHALHEHLTAREILSLFAKLRGFHGTQLQRTVQSLLTASSLDSCADKPVTELSGGTKRKISVSIAFMGMPKVILLDEPSNGVDASSRKFVWNLIDNAVQSGSTVLMSSHCMDECESVCNRVGFLVDGQLRCVGSPMELKDRFGGCGSYTVEFDLMGSVSSESDSIEDVPKKLMSNLPGFSAWSSLTPVNRPHSRHNRHQYEKPDAMPVSALVRIMCDLCRDKVVRNFSIRHSTLEDAFVNCVNSFAVPTPQTV